MFERPPFVTITLLVLCGLGFALTLLGHMAFLYSMLFQPVVMMPVGISFESVFSGLSQWQLWRPVSPIFVHFGWFHFAFNALALWYLGVAIEMRYGATLMAALCLLLALASNSCQYFAIGPHMFGGFSGVNFGLYGFCLALLLFKPKIDALPKSMHFVMPVFFVVGMLPLKEVWGFSDVANHAHVSGLLVGAVAGALVRYVELKKSNKDTVDNLL